MKIIKGIQEKYFREVFDGRKRFEVRLDDFKCKLGDILVLKEQKQGSKILTGRRIELEILYKLNTKHLSKYYSKKDIEKHGLLIMGIRRSYKPK